MGRMFQSKRGVTLYELVIVILLSAMICGLVATFCVYLSSYIDHAEELNSSVSEVSAVRSVVERWFSYYDSDDYDYTMSECSTDYYKQRYPAVYTVTASEKEGTASYAVSMDTDESGDLYLFLPYPDDEDNKIKVQYISKVEFSHLGGSDAYSCNITYGGNTLRFMLFRRVSVT